MNSETMKPLINRVDVLENRVDTIEDQRRKEGYGLKALIFLLGTIAGFVASALGSYTTARNIWKEHHARANIDLKLSPNLELSLSQDGQLNLKCGLTLNNGGDAKDVVNAVYPYLISALGAEERINFKVTRISEKGDSIFFPFSVKAEEVREVEINISTMLAPEKQQTFLETRPRILVLEFEFKESRPIPPVRGCFWLNQVSLDNLRESGRLRLDFADPRCLNLIYQ